MIRQLADLHLEGSTGRVHVCGEAYSDYHGFIEGALRSAVYVVSKIIERDTAKPSLYWLKEIGVDESYTEELRQWIFDLNSRPMKDIF